MMLPKSPAGFGKPCTDRSTWEDAGLRKRFDEPKVLKEAEKWLTEPVPAWDDALYLDYSKTGKRPPGETMLSRHGAPLFPLVIAECLENRGRFMPAINTALNTYCGDKSWTEPAHDGNLDCFYGRKYTVDLRASAFAADLGEALYLLGDKIDSPVRKRLRATIDKFVLSPMRESYKVGKGQWWMPARSNWNAVCLAGVTSTALTVIDDAGERAVFAAAAEHYVQNYLNSYTSDGYCVEGTGYWGYGFGNFAILREKLLQSTSGKLDLFANPMVHNIALYGSRIQMNDGLAPPFEDCRPGTRPDAGLIFYCNRSLGLGLSVSDHAPSVRDSLSKGCMDAFPNAGDHPNPTADAATTEAVGLRSYFDQVGVLICRPHPDSKCRLYVAIKSGGNGGHSHNDIGSFEIGLGEEQIVGDPGGPLAYNSETFGPNRYTKFKLYNSFGHPVPVVAGTLQLDATKVHPKVISTHFTNSEDVIVIDLTSAYSVPSLKSLVRTMRFNRRDITESRGLLATE